MALLLTVYSTVAKFKSASKGRFTEMGYTPPLSNSEIVEAAVPKTEKAVIDFSLPGGSCFITITS